MPHPVTEPTYKDYATERMQLVQELKDIQLKLAEPNHLDENGTRLNTITYQQWRMRALAAMRRREKRLAVVKAWLHDNRQAQPRAAQLEQKLGYAFRRARELVRLLDADQELAFSDEEMEAFESLKVALSDVDAMLTPMPRYQK
jgi:hypothetical protein